MAKKKSNKENLIEAQAKYIKLLEDELSEVSGLAWVHGWRSTKADAGEALRRRISSIKRAIKDR